MMLYLHLLQDQVSFIIVIIMFLYVKIKKVKFIKNLPTFAKLVYVFHFLSYYIIFFAGRGVCGRMVVGVPLTMQSVLITSEVVSSNPTHGEVYLIQHCA